MNHHTMQAFARGSLFLAFALMVQQLRILLSLPPFVMTLIIGSLVNLSLVLAGRFTAPAVIWAMSAALPAVAFMQGHLALPFMIPVVFFSNAAYAFFCKEAQRARLRILIAPLFKASCMTAGLFAVSSLFQVGPQLVWRFLLFYGSMQWATSFLGCLFFELVARRLAGKESV